MDVSVVIPTYNRADLIAETISSVLKQTVLPTEVIVVDDGSTDETASVVRGFGGNVRYLRIANSGAPVARNWGVAESSCSWIAFCDSDDLWLPEHLARHQELLQQYPEVQFSFSNFVLVHDGQFGRADKFGQAPANYWADAIETPYGLLFEKTLYRHLLRFQPIFQSTIVISRRRFQSVGGYSSKFARTLAEDFEFALRCADMPPLGAVTAPTVGIRKHRGNFSGNRLATLEGELQILDHARASHPGARQSVTLIDEQIASRTREAAELAFSIGELRRFRTLTRDLDPSELTGRMRIKLMVSRMPPFIGRPLAKALAQAKDCIRHITKAAD